MSLQDPIADMLTRIRNAQSVKKAFVIMDSSKLKESIAKVLKEEGYIKNYQIESNSNKRVLSLQLKYFESKSVIDELKKISKPGLRIYKSAKEIPLVRDGLGIAIMSTPKGIMTGKKAKDLNVGGEILCTVF